MDITEDQLPDNGPRKRQNNSCKYRRTNEIRLYRLFDERNCWPCLAGCKRRLKAGTPAHSYTACMKWAIFTTGPIKNLRV